VGTRGYTVISEKHGRWLVLECL
jgi:hypothetical protein